MTMQSFVRDPLESRLLDDWQRDLPLVPRPFAVIGAKLGIGEGEVIERLCALREAGTVARVGGVVRPNTLGASTLAAIAAPDLRADDVAGVLAEEPGVNHVYLRENDWNLWFVVTGPDRAYVDLAIGRIGRRTGLRVLDLRLERPYHIDLGFALDGHGQDRHSLSKAEASSCSDYAEADGDRALLQALTQGLPLTPRPFLDAADRLGRTERDVIGRLGVLVAAGIVPRIGVIVRHRALGWRSNAMVVWDVDGRDVDRAGAALARSPGINLCYRRTRYPHEWPFNLYCMVHARSRDEASGVLAEASRSAGLDGIPRRILFSLRCFKQTGALLAHPREAA
jgi:DNA-binding Lrp family transcriptional regulator